MALTDTWWIFSKFKFCVLDCRNFYSELSDEINGEWVKKTFLRERKTIRVNDAQVLLKELSGHKAHDVYKVIITNKDIDSEVLSLKVVREMVGQARQWMNGGQKQRWRELRSEREGELIKKKAGLQESWEDLSALVGFDFNGSQGSPTSNPFGPNSSTAFLTF